MDMFAVERLEERKSHLRHIFKVVVLLVVIVLGSLGLWLHSGLLEGSQAVPVLVGGQTRYARSCSYMTLMGQTTRVVGDPQPDAAATAAIPCPKHTPD